MNHGSEPAFTGLLSPLGNFENAPEPVIQQNSHQQEPIQIFYDARTGTYYYDNYQYPMLQSYIPVYHTNMDYHSQQLSDAPVPPPSTEYSYQLNSDSQDPNFIYVADPSNLNYSVSTNYPPRSMFEVPHTLELPIPVNNRSGTPAPTPRVSKGRKSRRVEDLNETPAQEARRKALQRKRSSKSSQAKKDHEASLKEMFLHEQEEGDRRDFEIAHITHTRQLFLEILEGSIMRNQTNDVIEEWQKLRQELNSFGPSVEQFRQETSQQSGTPTIQQSGILTVY